MSLFKDGKKTLFVLSQAVIAASLFFGSATGYASTSASTPYVNDDTWKFSITPYLWMLTMNGTTQVRDKRAHVDQNFSDILSKLNWAGMLFLEANKGKLGIFVNALYAKLSDESTARILTVKATNNFGLFSAGLSYDVYKLNAITLSPYAGFRYTLNNTSVIASIPQISIRRSLNENWTDPIVGLKLNYDITKAWSVILAGDIGGTNTSSDYSYNAQGVIGYSPQTMMTNITWYLGYRLLDQHYTTGTGKSYYNWNMKISGPMLGLSFKF